MSTNRALRSGPSRQLRVFNFINCTTRVVRITWIDFRGHAVTYRILQPEKDFQIITFEGHPWMAEDAQSNTRMLMNNKLVFNKLRSDDKKPGTSTNKKKKFSWSLLSSSENATVADVDEVRITIPVFTLAERCAQVAAKIFTSPNEIDSLVYPTSLKYVLKSYHTNTNSR